MEFTAATYGDSFADVYDEWYDDLGDPAIVVRHLRERLDYGATVLEVGAGTGRLSIPLALAGFYVVALDSSDAMLAALGANVGSLDPVVAARIQRIHADASVPGALAPRSVDAVLAPFNVLWNMADRDGQLACLRSCAAALRPGGRVIIECAVTELPEAREQRLVAREVTADRVVLIATDVDPRSATIVGQHIELRDGTVRLRPWRLSVRDPAEIDVMAGKAGLKLVERRADWQGSPFVEDESTAHVSHYTAATER